ncbi:MAG: hypothetical protein JSV30_00185 [Candidatus Omnitrophota bacterium]|nr:MAG: hypothetical protein JSV30_00185 [Candidatus Omnitrophota bacterium]
MKKITKKTSMPATIYKFNNTKKSGFNFPDFFFIDTSFLINSFFPVPEKIFSRINIICSDFLTLLETKAKSEEICLFTDNYVLNEFFFYILKNKVESVDFFTTPYDRHIQEYKDKGRKNPLSELLKDHHELIAKYYHLLKYYYERIMAIPIAVLEADHLQTKTTETVTEKMCNIVELYNILPADALNIAIAQEAGINDFIVIDADFHRVDGINVYTCISNRSPCSICPRK